MSDQYARPALRPELESGDNLPEPGLSWGDLPAEAQEEIPDSIKNGGTRVIGGTSNAHAGCSVPSTGNGRGTVGNLSPEISRPEYKTHDDWFTLDGVKHRPSLYYHTWEKQKDSSDPDPVDEWISSPIHALAMTANEHGSECGLLLRYLTHDGISHEWAAPMRLLKGSGEDLRGELLDIGVRIDPKNRPHLLRWMMCQYPKDKIIAASCTGWHGQSFVLPNTTLGDSAVRFQSESATHNDFSEKGTLDGWRNNIAALCRGNPLLVLSVSTAFAGPLLKVAKLQEAGGAGIHLVGDSSQGKTTALQAAGSVWGSPSIVRTWRATSNGMEAIAAAFNDSFLALDEISQCDPKEIGAIVYALANGVGKQRAARSGGTRATAHWRLMVLSSGERSLSAHMSEAGRKAKAGQEARLLSVPSTGRTHGLFDELHGFGDGREFADEIKKASGADYGHAGIAFVQYLLAEGGDFPAMYAKVCTLDCFASRDGVEGRAAGVFALVAMAGELATEYGITGWSEGEALDAAVSGFNAWREFRGGGQTEDRQILDSIRDFISRHGDSRFSAIGGDAIVNNRAGYWRDNVGGRVYLFNNTALKEAATSHDIRRILDALDGAGWITDHDQGKRSKKTKVAGSAVSLYAIRLESGELL